MKSATPEVRKFLGKLGLALAAAAAFFGGSVAMLVYSGELLPVDRIVEMRVKSPGSVSMYGCLYSSPRLYYQWQVALRTAPEVLALGTSRNQEMRGEFFRPGTSFYNASGPASKLSSYEYFLDSIPSGREPKVLILGLDQFFFNPNWDFYDGPDDPEEGFSYKYDYREILKLGLTGVHRDILKNGLPRGVFSLRRGGRVGLGALLEHTGLRSDGSLAIDVSRIKPSRHNDALRFAESGRKAFAHSDSVHMPAVARLERLLSKCRARGIHVVAFFPPYAHCVYEKMMSMGDRHSYIPKLRALMPGVFRKYAFGFYDFTDLKDLGASDMETVDGYHGSEKAYLRLFIRMAAADGRLGRYADVRELESALAATKGDQTVFPEN